VLLTAIAYETICFLDLAIGLWMCDGCKLQLDAYTFAIVLEFSRSEFNAIVCDYDVRDAILLLPPHSP
jgi:hypothetical protein